MYIRDEIQSTFKQLVLQQDQPITVRLICDTLNISRKTFYKYYHDIEDLVSKIIEDDIYNPLTQLSTMNHIKTEDSITVLNSMYSTIYDHRHVYKKLYYLYKKEELLNILMLNGIRLNNEDKQIIDNYQG